MKGYELILFANAFVFLLIGLLVLLNGTALQRQGNECASGNVEQCQRDIAIGQGAQSTLPYFFALSAALFGIASTLVLHRRWYRSPTQELDEGPGYP